MPDIARPAGNKQFTNPPKKPTTPSTKIIYDLRNQFIGKLQEIRSYFLSLFFCGGGVGLIPPRRSFLESDSSSGVFASARRRLRSASAFAASLRFGLHLFLARLKLRGVNAARLGDLSARFPPLSLFQIDIHRDQMVNLIDKERSHRQHNHQQEADGACQETPSPCRVGNAADEFTDDIAVADERGYPR